MRERIRVEELEVGMYVAALPGRWLDHPFWRTRFAVRSERELATLRASGIDECWIDTAKGRRPARRERGPRIDLLPDARSGDRPGGEAGAPASAPLRRVSFDEEIEPAAAVCRQASAAVQSLFHDVRLGRAIDAEQWAVLVEDITGSVSRHPAALVSLARMRSHHGYTFLHSVAVSALMVALAGRLGLSADEVREAGWAGLLHDVGKAAIPGALLNKPGRLSDHEFERMKDHPQQGYAWLAATGGIPATVLSACLHHHERFDGHGYPHGLHGEAIPLAARMCAVCDVYDAITSRRPYKVAWDPARSLSAMSNWTQRGQFDPALFHVFVNTVGIYPVGSLVRLQSGRLGLVVEHNDAALVQPVVKVFYSTRSGMPIPVRRLDLARPGQPDAIVARESNADWGFAHLDEMLLGSATRGRIELG